MNHFATQSTQQGFGPYSIYERIGIGGMAAVHRAVKNGIEGFRRPCALKRILPHLAEEEHFIRSFVREARLASYLHHPNIVQIYDLGRVGSDYFIAMEYLTGRDLRRVLRRMHRATGPMPPRIALTLLHQLCDALDYAHGCRDGSGAPLGIVHRDVSPSNIMVTESGHLKVIDFGIAKATNRKMRTQTGLVKGKFAYLSPEAIAGDELDGRSDIFGVGVIAYEMLTAVPLFARKTEYATVQRVLEHQVPPLDRVNPQCNERVAGLVHKALARDPASRWQSAADLRAAIEVAAQDYDSLAAPSEVAAWLQQTFAGETAQERRESARKLRLVGAADRGAGGGSQAEHPADIDSRVARHDQFAGDATEVDLSPMPEAIPQSSAALEPYEHVEIETPTERVSREQILASAEALLSALESSPPSDPVAPLEPRRRSVHNAVLGRLMTPQGVALLGFILVLTVFAILTVVAGVSE